MIAAYRKEGDFMNIDGLIGVPFVDGGREVKTGLDCWGLVMEVYRRQGIELPDYTISAMSAKDIAKAMADNEKSWKKLDAPKTPCLVVIRLAHAGWANHAGVYLGEDKFIHAYIKTGVCIDRVRHWRSRVVGFYVPGWLE